MTTTGRPAPPSLAAQRLRAQLLSGAPARTIAQVEMLNLLGAEVDAWPKFAAEPESRLHLYGKREAKPGRKMGHVNRVKPLR